MLNTYRKPLFLCKLQSWFKLISGVFGFLTPQSPQWPPGKLAAGVSFCRSRVQIDMHMKKKKLKVFWWLEKISDRQSWLHFCPFLQLQRSKVQGQLMSYDLPSLNTQRLRLFFLSSLRWPVTGWTAGQTQQRWWWRLIARGGRSSVAVQTHTRSYL